MESKLPTLETLSPPLAAYMDDLTRLLPEPAMPEWEVLAGDVPHLVLLFDAPGDPAAPLQEAVQVCEDHARNHRLFVESQWARDDSGRAAIVVSSPFPTVRLSWDAHPFEEVPDEGGVWRESFADLGDVESLQGTAEGHTTLYFDDAVTRRIDADARQSGHRRFHLWVGPLGDERLMGPYVWMPGLGRVRGIPDSGAAAMDTSYTEMHDRFASRKAARDRIGHWLSLADDGLWIATSKRAHYRASLMLWVMKDMHAGNELPFYAPWFSVDEGDSRWVPLQAGSFDFVATALPDSWALRAISTSPTAPATLVLSGDADASEDAASQEFLRQHHGRDVVALVHGEVVGILSISDSQTNSMELKTDPGVRAEDVIARVQQLGRGGSVATEAMAAQLEETETAIRTLDFFQVRIMAEPQDRKIVPVTHFAAPGVTVGAMVAVLNDIILDSRSVTDARIEVREDRTYLHLSLTPEGKDSLSDACFAHLGKQLAIVYEDRLLCAPTIVDWAPEELTFKGLNADWPEVAADMVTRLGKG